jgi:hypothetical protein
MWDQGFPSKRFVLGYPVSAATCGGSTRRCGLR